MKILKIAGKDLKGIIKNKFVIISVIAIIIVPMLYSMLYLDAFWDPYAKLEDVPVAVVNLDNGAKLDGKNVNYGADIVKELEGNSEIGWVITDEKDASDGLNGDEYYAVVQIPNNFSSDVIAAKDGSPKVANISFTCNEKKNFLAAQVNSKVQAELKANVTKTISNNYVTVAFDSLYKAKDGMVAAADGSTQIKDGIDTLNDKIPTMTTGVNELFNGSNQLTDAQKQLDSGINTLNSGVTSLNNGASSLSNGASQLDNGVSTIKNKVPELSDGVSNLADGSKTLFDAYNNELLPGVNDVNNGLNALNSKLDEGQSNIDLISQGVKSLEENTPLLTNGANEIKGYEQAINDEYSKIIQGSSDLSSGIGQVAAGAQFTNTEVANIGNSINELIKANPELANDVNMQNIISSLTSLDNKKVEMEQGLASLVQGSDNLTTGINNFNSQGLAPYISGVNTFADETIEYSTGATAIAQGTGQLIQSLGDVKNAVGMLSTGTNNIYNSMILSNKDGFGYGLASISQGTDLLNSKIPELSSGINQISDGSTQLKSGSQSLLEGSNQLVSGAKNLQNGSSSILDGQVKLNEGISELHGSLPELTTGVTKLQDGSTELTNKLDDGAREMKEGLVNSSEVMGEYVSEPMTLDTNPVNPVPNYGTGFAPYFIPLSLWIGAIMMFFVIPTKIKEEDKDASKFSKVIGKYITFGIVGVLQALLVSFVVLVILGLHPTSVVAFVCTNVVLSLVFVGIVQCLILLLGDAGRLISIVFLILQLTGCAGTFPLEIIPKFFKVINPFMPFTYAVEALREVISATTINYSVIGRDFGILVIILIIFLVICTIFRDKGEKIADKITKSREV